jgi:hypothetical protein
MRFLIAGLLLAASVPLAGAPDQKSQCKTTCSAQYDFCMKSSRTKQMRKNCAIARKKCKNGCVNTTLPH